MSLQQGFDEGASLSIRLLICPPALGAWSWAACTCDRVCVRDKHGVSAGGNQRKGGSARCAHTPKHKERAIMRLLHMRGAAPCMAHDHDSIQACFWVETLNYQTA